MPHIQVAMERSLQNRSLLEGMQDLVKRSVVAALSKRQSMDDIGNSIDDVGTALSSWDNCMAADFCKWPAIAIMVVGGLIIISIVWCCARCLCFGMSCCCSCFRCLKCCGNCCGCCDPPGGRSHKYLDEPYAPPNHDDRGGLGYRPEPPMNRYSTGISKSGSAAPQYAEFDTGNKKDNDSLPAMPSWDDSGSKKVAMDDEPVELKNLEKPDNSQSNLGLSRAGSPGPASPAFPQGRPGPNGYMRSEGDPYGLDQSYGADSKHGYGSSYESQAQANPYDPTATGMDQSYGMAGALAGQRTRTPYQDPNSNMGYRGTPGPHDNNKYRGMGGPGMGGPGEYSRSGTPGSYNNQYARTGTPGSYGMGPGQRPPPQRYGTPASRMQSPGPLAAYDGYRTGSPAISATGGPPAAYNGYRTGSPAMPAAYNPARTASPALAAAAGFDQRSQTPNSYGRQISGPPQRQYPQDTQQPYGSMPQRQYSTDSFGQQHPSAQRQYSTGSQSQYTGPPQRQYSIGSQSQYPSEVAGDYPTETTQYAKPMPPAPVEVPGSPASPLQNNGGFDFTSGASRPSTSSSPAPAPGQTANGGTAYPGYKPYRPAQ